MLAADMPTEEEIKLVMEKRDKIYNAFGQAYSEIGIDYNTLSVKEKYYLMKDEQVSAALEQSFLNILKDTQGSSFIQSTI